MKYFSTAYMSTIWKITPHRIAILAKQGRIYGAVQIGSRWMIPDNAIKPADARTKSAMAKEKNEAFCFRFYEKCAENSFAPPLTEEEIKIRKASDAFLACRFEESADILGDLPKTAKNRYVRIMALYSACMISFILNKSELFLDSYGKLCAVFQEDFPYKQEMELLLLELNATLGDTKGLTQKLAVNPAKPFHHDCLSHLSALSTIAVFYGKIENFTPHYIQAQEINCALLENSSDNKIDLQTLHIHLGLINEMQGNKEAKKFHLCRAFELAEKYELYWLPAMQYYYMGASFDEVLINYSPAFAKKIRTLSEDIHFRREIFMKTANFKSVFDLLASKQFLFMFYATQGFNSKEVAKRMHLSESSVKKTYSAIYQSLGIDNKKELVEFYNNFGKKK